MKKFIYIIVCLFVTLVVNASSFSSRNERICIVPSMYNGEKVTSVNIEYTNKYESNTVNKIDIPSVTFGVIEFTADKDITIDTIRVRSNVYFVNESKVNIKCLFMSLSNNKIPMITNGDFNKNLVNIEKIIVDDAHADYVKNNIKCYTVLSETEYYHPETNNKESDEEVARVTYTLDANGNYAVAHATNLLNVDIDSKVSINGKNYTVKEAYIEYNTQYTLYDENPNFFKVNHINIPSTVTSGSISIYTLQDLQVVNLNLEGQVEWIAFNNVWVTNFNLGNKGNFTNNVSSRTISYIEEYIDKGNGYTSRNVTKEIEYSEYFECLNVLNFNNKNNYFVPAYKWGYIENINSCKIIGNAKGIYEDSWGVSDFIDWDETTAIESISNNSFTADAYDINGNPVDLSSFKGLVLVKKNGKYIKMINK